MTTRLVTASACWRKASASPLCVLLLHQTPQSLPLRRGLPSPPRSLDPSCSCSLYHLHIHLFARWWWTSSGHRLTHSLNHWHLTWWLAEKRWANQALSNDWGHKPSALMTRPKSTRVFWTWDLPSRLSSFPVPPYPELSLYFLSQEHPFIYLGQQFSVLAAQ